MSKLLSLWGLYHQHSIAHGSLVWHVLYGDILVFRLKSMIGADVLLRQNGAMREIGKWDELIRRRGRTKLMAVFGALRG